MFESNPLYQEDLFRVAELKLPWDKFNNKTILVSGASGLLGTFLIDVLMLRNERHGMDIRLIALGRSQKKAQKRFYKYWQSKFFSFIPHDINNPLQDIGRVDYIIHAASNTHPVAYATDPIGTITANVIGTQNLLDYAVKHNSLRVMFLSTVEIYGQNRGDTEYFNEKYCGYIDCNTVRAGYPESKRLGESLCNAYISQYGLDIVIPRLCRIYGPTMQKTDTKALSQFIRNALQGEDIVLKSEGNQLYSYCYCADAVAALLTVLLCGKSGEAYNVADKRSDITLRDLAQTIASIVGRKVVFQLPDSVESEGFSRVTKALLDSTKLQELGWKAHDNIQTGLEKTIKILKEEWNQE